MGFLVGVINVMFLMIFWAVLFLIVAIIGFVVGGTPQLYKNFQSGDEKLVRPGFSFTYLFFGCLQPLFRGEFLMFIFTFFLDTCTLLLFRVGFAFFINKFYISSLEKRGYVHVNPMDYVNGSMPNGEPPVREYE